MQPTGSPVAHAPSTWSPRLSEEYSQLAERWLPVTDSRGPWRASRALGTGDPDQGWKLHVTATVVTAAATLSACAPVAQRYGIAFKACKDLHTLQTLSSGLNHGFSQVGKFLTFYPQNPAQALRIARELDICTADIGGGPRVPYDLPYRPGSSVFYRYGSFIHREYQLVDGSFAPAIHDPSGKPWTDERAPGHAVPQWVANPFQLYDDVTEVGSPLLTRFLVHEALIQRGRGGVYRAVDLLTRPASECVIKEGRPFGEASGDGWDGVRLVAHEGEVLRELAAAGLPVPKVRADFEVDGHYYLVMDDLGPRNLMNYCCNPARTLPLSMACQLGADLAELVDGMHAAGWVWRDCKPMNVLLSPDASLNVIDFEGSVRRGDFSTRPWGSPGYTAPEVGHRVDNGDNLAEDLYSLGASLRHLVTSVLPAPGRIAPGSTQVGRADLPSAVRRVIGDLLSPDPRHRPAAATVARILRPFARPFTMQRIERYVLPELPADHDHESDHHHDHAA